MMMDRDTWLAIRATPRRAKPPRYLHVSTRYGLRVTQVMPRTIQFVKLEKGVTYRRAESKPLRLGLARRVRLFLDRAVAHIALTQSFGAAYQL